MQWPQPQLAQLAVPLVVLQQRAQTHDQRLALIQSAQHLYSRPQLAGGLRGAGCNDANIHTGSWRVELAGRRRVSHCLTHGLHGLHLLLHRCHCGLRWTRPNSVSTRYPETACVDAEAVSALQLEIVPS